MRAVRILLMPNRAITTNSQKGTAIHGREHCCCRLRFERPPQERGERPRDGVTGAAKDGSADARAAAENAIPAASRFLARLVYTTSYTVTYGVVFPSLIVAKSLPADNVIIRGFADGAHAAVEKVDQLKQRQASSASL